MTKWLLLAPLFVSTLGCSVTENPPATDAEALEQSKYVLEEIAKANFKNIEISGVLSERQDETFPFSFEKEEACDKFDLTEAEVREYFKNAKVQTEFKIDRKGKFPASRCSIGGKAELNNGSFIYWEINKSRHGVTRLRLSSDSKYATVGHPRYFTCDQCTSDKFYPPKWDGEEFRPVVKNIKIEENGVPYVPSEIWDVQELTEACMDSRLSVVDVTEFFKIARASTEREFSQVRINRTPSCSASGVATLDGKKVKWHIGSDRYGIIRPEKGDLIYYYCHDCNPKVLGSDCDFACEMSGGEE